MQASRDERRVQRRATYAARALACGLRLVSLATHASHCSFCSATMWTIDYAPVSDVGASAAIVLIPILVLFVLLFTTRAIIAAWVALVIFIAVAAGGRPQQAIQGC